VKKIYLILLSVSTGLLLSAGWPANGFPVFLFIAFLPLLYIEDHIYKNRDTFSRYALFFYSYPAFFVWNILTTWWIWNATAFGAVMAVVLNSFFMSLVFHLYHFARKNLAANRYAFLVLPFFWITYEYFHMNWDLSWPWLTLGNGFASFSKWIQWYEFTGVLGGTFWIIFVNQLFYRTFVNAFINKDKTTAVKYVAVSLIMIVIPVGFSIYLYHHYDEKPEPFHIVVVQPNNDPYTEQYQTAPEEVTGELITMASGSVDSTTDFVVCPESALQEYIWESRIRSSPSLKMIHNYVKDFDKLAFIVGMSTRRVYEKGEEVSSTARKFRDADAWYDAYNTATLVDRSFRLPLYHKSKLTPGVEVMPFRGVFKHIENFAIDLGGTVGSLGIDKERKPLARAHDSLKVATVICYESVYGEFCAKFIRNGAGLIFIITNDGWWGDTPGHKQHNSYAVLRAIETRRSIARSANTGISCFINQRGDFSQETEYWKPDVIKGTINANSRLTFYVKYGDYIARITTLFSLLIILIALVSRKATPWKTGIHILIWAGMAYYLLGLIF